MNQARPWILLTNDDGVDSPALVPLLQRLSSCAEVRALVPAAECSWTSKIMSRFGRLTLDEVERQGLCIRTLDGYPADCANIGIHSLFDSRPALVVSGINLGANAGLAYFLSSGTIGAALEAVLSGVPALALSLQLSPQDYQRWRRQRDLSALGPEWEPAAAVAGEVVEEVLRGGLPAGASLLSVNMPPHTHPATPRRFAGLTPTSYGSFFSSTSAPERFEYSLSGLQVRQGAEGGDMAVLARGEVALTPIRFTLEAEPSEADRRRFERRGECL